MTVISTIISRFELGQDQRVLAPSSPSYIAQSGSEAFVSCWQARI